MRLASCRPRVAASSDATAPRSSQDAADLDQAVVQLVHDLRVLVGVVDLAVDVADVSVGGAVFADLVVLPGDVRVERRSWCEQPADGEVTVVSTTARPRRSCAALS